MKKILVAVLILLFTSSNYICVLCETVDVEWMDGNYKNDHFITYCGKGYLKWIDQDSVEFNENETNITGVDRISENKFLVCFSSDGEHWENILNENNKDVFSRYYNNHEVECGVIEADSYYIMYSKYLTCFGLNSYRRTGNGLTVFDKNFKVIKDCPDIGYIANISFVDEKCYITQYTEYLSDTLPPNRSKYGWCPYAEYGLATKQRTIYTSDFDNWYTYSDNGSIPLKSKNGTIEIQNSLFNKISDNEADLKPTTVKVVNVDSENKIEYEEIAVAQIQTFRDLFVAIPSHENNKFANKFGISMDGVYFTMINLPDQVYKNSMPDNTQEYGIKGIFEYDDIYALVLFSDYNTYGHLGGPRYYCKIADLYNSIIDSSVYVQLNDKILGFSQPPVMEDDRTLVPMRFLFEQMGASVDWNDETQTATASVPMSTEQQMMTFSGARGEVQNTVTFSIDNTTATVNGETETMDVPARLINDQTFVPLRFLSENLGCDVQWDETTNTAIVTTE